MQSVGRWASGLGAVAVLMATGVWVLGSGTVDSRLWGEVRPVIEARLVADSRGSGYGETVPDLRARWFCRAEALDLGEDDGVVRAGVNTLCMEYGVRAGALVECGGARYPQVLRLAREADGDYRVVSREEPPDGAGYGEWTEDNFSFFAESDADDTMSSTALETAARSHFGLPAHARVAAC
ncbi:hypothetical protein [Streptomyces sp. NBC_00576]|uniref:hypothetical protein n=1 Tax=Streptomyces sp. NBC_00576 TaxID=2903665 RepID=UPI002E7FE8D7|nr:hypothetical protein [Streptomyces sp. NBC_00576]WUB72386.1 hypothetical protein OG734_20970 [Streptomyces sp. NBC_00576]